MGLVEIEYDDVVDGFTDIAGDVLYRTAAFEGQLAAIPGMFECVVKDVDQTYNFVSGRELRLTVGGQRYWGGFLTQVEEFYATIVDTSVPADVQVRQWQLRGVDYNILFDKRVLANYSNPTSGIPAFAVGTTDGDAITTLINTYLDTDDDDLDLSGIDNVASLTPDDVKGTYGVPGEKWRQAMQRFANTTGATWYINAEKTVVNREREDETLSWGFSDAPDNVDTFGPQGIRYTTDGSSVVNDALVWGGSGFASGTVAFGRVENTDSIARGLRMQFGRTQFNKPGYFTNNSCRKHASVIVTGAPGTVAIVGDGPDSERGLQNPQQLLSLSWFYGMVPGPLIPGQVVTTTLWTFGAPKVITLPLRGVRITFPSPEIVKFDGNFGIQTTDPYSLWAYMRRQADEAAEVVYIPPIVDDAVDPIPGGTFTNSNVTPATDGSTTVFTLRFPYLVASTKVYKNGLLLIRGTDYTESDPTAGEITMTTAPAESDVLYAEAQASGASTLPTPGSGAFLSYPSSGLINLSGGTNRLVENISINNGTLNSVAGVGITISGAHNVTIQDLDLTNLVGGIYLYNCTGTLLIDNVRSRNIGDGTIGSGHSNHIQLSECAMSGRISNCRFLGGRTEDMVSIYHSGGLGVGQEIIVENNMLQGLVTDTAKARAWTSNSGTGVILSDGAGDPNNGYIIVRNNSFLTPGQVGIQIIDGPGLQVYNNVIYGQQRSGNNNPMTTWEGTPVGVAHDNRYLWYNANGSLQSPWFQGGVNPQVTAYNNVQDNSLVPGDYVITLTEA